MDARMNAMVIEARIREIARLERQAARLSRDVNTNNRPSTRTRPAERRERRRRFALTMPWRRPTTTRVDR